MRRLYLFGLAKQEGGSFEETLTGNERGILAIGKGEQTRAVGPCCNRLGRALLGRKRKTTVSEEERSYAKGEKSHKVTSASGDSCARVVNYVEKKKTLKGRRKKEGEL